MIPKSVSGSTIIIALGAVVAWPVWGWAGESDWMAKSSSGDTIVFLPGTYDKDHPPTLAPKRLQCYVKMREAMRLAEKHQFWPLFTFAPEDREIGASRIPTPRKPSQCDEICAAQLTLDTAVKRKKDLDEREQAKKQWDQVMKECVEGK